jgi:hypothetical protein
MAKDHAAELEETLAADTVPSLLPGDEMTGPLAS